MAKRISDQERLEYVKQYKTSGMTVSEFIYKRVYFLKKVHLYT